MPATSFDTAQGRVSAIFDFPDNASALLVLGHGAGADMHHVHMQSLADALAGEDIATFRFNFPFKEFGRHRPDSPAVCIDTISNAVAIASTASTLPLFLGGHSFGGRMASHYAASDDAKAPPGNIVRGLLYFSFPLHPANKPDIKRAEHLDEITRPQLFLSGTRDKLAELERLRGVVTRLEEARLHELETADHSFKILKRSRTSDENIYAEAARVARQFIDDLA